VTSNDVPTSGGTLALRADQTEWTEPQKAALAQLGVGDAPLGDQLVFLHVAQRMRLDPFNKEIYMIGRWDPESGRKKWTIQVAIDGFRSKSEEHPEYAGIEGPEWCGPDGEWRDVWLSDEPPVAARFTVFRKDWEHPIRATAHYREYVQTKKDGKPTAMWANRPAGQLGKCAEALARRKAFPRSLRGVYIDEELQHLSNPQAGPVVIESERVDKTPAPDWDDLIHKAVRTQDVDKLRQLYDMAKGMFPNDRDLLNKIAEAGERVKQFKAAVANTPELAAEPEPEPDHESEFEPEGGLPRPTLQQQRNRLFALLRDGGVYGNDRERRLLIVSRLLNRPSSQRVGSFDELTEEDYEQINAFLQRRKNDGDLTHTLAELGTDHGAEQTPE